MARPPQRGRRSPTHGQDAEETDHEAVVVVALHTCRRITDDCSMTSQQTIDLFRRFVIGNYKRYPVCLTRGEGSYVWDAEGKRYLDFFPGWGCDLLGHCPPRVVKAVQEQIAQLIHVPNTWHI